MIVYVKEIGTRRTPFAMRRTSAERLIGTNQGKYEIIGDEVEPIKIKAEPKRKKKAAAVDEIKD
jgi:hypothetical protein